MSSRSDREARRARKQARFQRDAENEGGGSNYVTAISRAGYEFDFFKIKEEGWLNLHIIPYIIRTRNHPEVVRGEMEVGDEDYFLEFATHRYIGPDGKGTVLCLKRTYGRACPICEHAEELREAGQSDNLPWPSRRVMYDIIDDDGKFVPQVFEVSEKLFHDELKGKMLRSKRGAFDYSDVKTGAMIQCFAKENKSGRYKFWEFKDFTFVERDPLDESVIDAAIPLDQLLNVPTYEQVREYYEGEVSTIKYDRNSDDSQRTTTTVEAEVRDESGAEAEDTGYTERDNRIDNGEEPETPENNTAKRRNTEEGERRQRSTPERGSQCPLGLRYGDDFDTDNRKCGCDCKDADYALCEKLSQ